MKKRVLGPGTTPMVAGVVAGGVDARTVKRAVAEGADLIEARVDTFAAGDSGEIKKSVERLRALAGGVPVLLTVRSRAEGGARALAPRERARIFEDLMPLADMIDIELSSSTILESVVKSARRHRKKVIVSYHNFRSTPDGRRLKEIIKRGREAGADIVKVAAMARTKADLKRLAGLLLESDDLIVIAMGQPGVGSRVFFPMLGSLVTYGYLTGETAPGQLSLKTIKKEFSLYGLG